MALKNKTTMATSTTSFSRGYYGICRRRLRRCCCCCSSGFWKILLLCLALIFVGHMIRTGMQSTSIMMDIDIPSAPLFVPTTVSSNTKPKQQQQQQDEVPVSNKPSPPFVVVWKNRTVTPVPDSIQFFYNEIRSDRSGAMIIDMLMAHAFSWKFGRTYAGVCGKNKIHSKDHRRMVQALALQHELPYPERPQRCHQINTSNAWALPRNAYNYNDTGIFSPAWIKYMRQQQQREREQREREQQQRKETNASKPRSPLRQNESIPQQLLTSSSSSLSSSISTPTPQEWHRILVYIRRGDVTPCIVANFRYLPNSHYLQLMDRYTNQTNVMYHITIYSQSESFEGWNDFHKHLDAKPNIHYHLALDGDMSDVWQDMMGWRRHKDHSIRIPIPPLPPPSRVVFILSRSAFSLVPAILAPSSTIVVYTPLYFHHPLPHWHVIDNKLVQGSFARVAKLRREQCRKMMEHNSSSNNNNINNNISINNINDNHKSINQILRVSNNQSNNNSNDNNNQANNDHIINYHINNNHSNSSSSSTTTTTTTNRSIVAVWKRNRRKRGTSRKKKR